MHAGITDAMIKRQEDFFIKIFTSHFICKGSKRVTQGLHVRGSWRPNITEIFWPNRYDRQRCVFLVLLWTLIQSGLPRAPSTGCGFPYHNSTPTDTRTPLSLLLFNSSALYYLQTPRRWYGTRLHAFAISSDIWRSGCVTSAIFGMACVIVIERK